MYFTSVVVMVNHVLRFLLPFRGPFSAVPGIPRKTVIHEPTSSEDPPSDHHIHLLRQPLMCTRLPIFLWFFFGKSLRRRIDVQCRLWQDMQQERVNLVGHWHIHAHIEWMTRQRSCHESALLGVFIMPATGISGQWAATHIDTAALARHLGMIT